MKDFKSKKEIFVISIAVLLPCVFSRTIASCENELSVTQNNAHHQNSNTVNSDNKFKLKDESNNFLTVDPYTKLMNHTEGTPNSELLITWFTFCNQYNEGNSTDEICIAGYRLHRLYYDDIHEIFMILLQSKARNNHKLMYITKTDRGDRNDKPHCYIHEATCQPGSENDETIRVDIEERSKKLLPKKVPKCGPSQVDFNFEIQGVLL
jgi:hypothetical protein